MNRLLVLDWSEEWRPYLTTVYEKLDSEIYLIVPEKRPTPVFAKKCIVIDSLYRDNKSTLDKLVKIVEEYRINSIYTTEDELIALSTKVSEKYGLVGPTYNAVKSCMNKFDTRERLRKSRVAMPKYSKIKKMKELESEIGNYSYPVILKPIDGNFSTGAIKINNKDGLEEAWERAIKGTDESPTGSRELILEEFIRDNGSSKVNIYSCEAVISNGEQYILGITNEVQKKFITQQKNEVFLYDRVILPAQLKCSIQDEIVKCTQEIIEFLKLDNCTVHIEFKIKNGHPVLLEVNPRMIGGFVPELYKTVLGIDIAELSVKVALGKEISINKAKNVIGGIKFLYPAIEGEISAISPDHKMLKNLGLEKYKLILDVGKKVEFSEFLGVGYGLAVSDNIERVNRVLDEIEETIKVSVNQKV